MKRRFTDEQIIGMIKEYEAGLCQVNRIHSEISVNCRWPLYAISMA